MNLDSSSRPAVDPWSDVSREDFFLLEVETLLGDSPALQGVPSYNSLRLDTRFKMLHLYSDDTSRKFLLFSVEGRYPRSQRVPSPYLGDAMFQTFQ